MDPPEVVVGELDRSGCLERHDPAALRVDAREHALDRPVLAGRVQALEHEQHRASAFGREPGVLQSEGLDPVREAVEPFLLVEAARTGVRFPLIQPRGGSGRDAELAEELRLHSGILPALGIGEVVQQTIGRGG